jgi:hypothetical protein
VSAMRGLWGLTVGYKRIGQKFSVDSAPTRVWIAVLVPSPITALNVAKTAIETRTATATESRGSTGITAASPTKLAHSPTRRLASLYVRRAALLIQLNARPVWKTRTGVLAINVSAMRIGKGQTAQLLTTKATVHTAV